MNRLQGKVALITRAVQGIGETIAHAFIKGGASIYLSDISEELGHDTAKNLGTSARYLRLDVRKESDWAAVT